MDLDGAKLVVFLFYLLPGYLTIQVYEWWLGTHKRSPLDEIAWSILATVGGAAVLVALPWTRGSMEYLWHPVLSEKTFIGAGLQLIVAFALGLVAALVAKKLFGGRLGRRSLHSRVWDGLWSEHAKEDRYVGVLTESGYYLGALAGAESSEVGQSIMLWHPRLWDEASRTYHVMRAEFSYIPGEQIRRVDLTITTEQAVKNEREEERTIAAAQANGQLGAESRGGKGNEGSASPRARPEGGLVGAKREHGAAEGPADH